MKLYKLLTSLVLAAVITVGTLGSVGCGSDELKTNAKIAHRSFVTLRAFRDLNASLHDRSKLTKEEFAANVGYLQDASKVGGEFLAAVDKSLSEIEGIERQLAANTDPNEKKVLEERLKSAQFFAGDNIRPLAKAFATALRNLNDNGVLRVKNADARAQLSDLLGWVLSLL